MEAPSLEERERSGRPELSAQKSSAHTVSRSISKQLTVLLGVSLLFLLLSTILLTYSLYFCYVFFAFGNTTSYFPWAWGIGYSDFASVWEMTASGVIPSVTTIGFTISSVICTRRKIKEEIFPPLEKLGTDESKAETDSLASLFPSSVLLCFWGVFLIAFGFAEALFSGAFVSGATMSLSQEIVAGTGAGLIITGVGSFGAAIASAIFSNES